MWILLDISILVLLIIFVVSSYKAGIVRSLLRLIGTIVAIVLSAYMASIIAQFVYDQFIRSSILDQVRIFINEYVTNDISSKPVNSLNGMSEFILRSLMFYGYDEHTIKEIINDSTLNAANEITNMISPMIINSIRTIVMIILFILFNTIIRFLIRSLGAVCRLPIIKQVDSILGAILGAINFLIIVMIIMLLIRIFVPMMKDEPKIFSSVTIDSTYIFKHLYYNNPLYEIFENVII